MAARGRGGRFGSGGGGWGGNSRGRGASGGSSVAGRRDMTCACEANSALLVELRSLDDECLRTGKVKLRHGLLRAMKSLQRYPLPITTEKEACALEGVGTFTARRMMRGLTSPAPATDERSSISSSRTSNEENIQPSRASSASSAPASSSVGAGRTANRNKSSTSGCAPSCRTSSSTGSSCCASSVGKSARDNTSLLRMNLRVGDGSSRSRSNSNNNTGSGIMRIGGCPLSLASNFAAIRGDVGTGGAQTPDVTPKRPTSRARREEVDDGAALMEASKAPRFFSGHWEAWLIVDNREHEFMSMQSSLLQKGVRCETRQLPLGDMLWIARREDDPTSEVLLGYIVERKTASDLASSIVDGRYDEQKRRLKLSGLRRRIYLVEGNLTHQSQLAPSALRTALASSQACGGLAVVQCDSLRDTVDFLARTHRHIASLLEKTCKSHHAAIAGEEGGGGGRGAELWSGTGSGGGGGGGGGMLRPAMTYGEYAQGCAKRASSTTARQVLGAMVRQAPGCSGSRAEAIVRAFESPLGLMLALERAADRGGGGGNGGENDDVVRMKGADDLLAGLVCRGGAGTNKLPQPLRRLLCRLFLGESVVDGGVSGGDGGDPGGRTHEGWAIGSQGDSDGRSPCDVLGRIPYLADGWDVEPMSQDDPYY